MLRRAFFAAALLMTPAFLTSEAHAADGSGQPVGQYVDLQPVALPVVVSGRLVNYVFVYVRVNLAPNADVAKVRAREPMLRDALVRMGARTPFTNPADYNRVDEAKVCAAMQQAVTAIVGPGVVRSVAVTSQTPQHRIATPRR